MWGQDTFIEKAGGSEVIGQMWAFADKAGRPCCLIPEATALFQETAGQLLAGRTQAMFFYVARCYRYEKPQAGRYREFTQLGLEILGPDPRQALVQAQQLCTGFLDALALDYELNLGGQAWPDLLPGWRGFRGALPAPRGAATSGGGGAYRQGAGFGIGLERLQLALQAQA